MFFLRYFSFLIVLIAMSEPVMASAEPELLILKPTSKWQVDYAEDRCRLARKFGEGDEEVIALVDRFEPSEFFRLTVSVKPLKKFQNNIDAVIQFGPEEEQKVGFRNGTLGQDRPALIFTSQMRLAPLNAEEKLAREKGDYTKWANLGSIDFSREETVRYLKIGKPLRRPILLQTGSMKAPFAALNKCIDELMTHWGIDVEKHRLLSRRVTPVGSPGQWITTYDYPVRMLREGQPSIVEFRLNVGADGMPTACHIQLTTRAKEFDDAVCKSLMRRARFEPALDAEGKPFASYWRNTVHFNLP